MTRDSCMWGIGTVKSYRLSSRKILGKYGGNIQNIEKQLREIYIPDDGMMFSQTDQSGAEALIVAYLCEAGNFRQLFIHNVKPHVYVAMHLFKDIWQKKFRNEVEGKPFNIGELCNTPIQALKSHIYWKDLDALIKDSDNWSADERYYYLAKQTCHSSNYGVTANPFRMNILEKSGGKINVSKDEAERFLFIYHNLFPEIRQWHDRVRRQVEKTGIIYNLHGHPMIITTHKIEENKWKEIYALTPQSTVGMITNIAYRDMQRFIENNSLNWDMLINGHDSILSQSPINEIMDCAKKQKEFIEQEFTSPVDGTVFKMRSETQVGLNWRPYKEGKNPNGLKEVKI